METSEYEQMAKMEETYWWHVGRKHIIRKQLNRLNLPPDARILNIGSGTGDMIPLLERYGKVTNVEVSSEAIRYAKHRGHTTIKINGKTLPFKTGSFDLAVAFDVLEHIPDDFQALKTWRRVLAPNGALMVTVPAYAWLWSGHDESLHHYRRYTISNLHRLFNLAGYRVEKRTYAITFSFPMIVAFRFMQSLWSKDPKTSYVVLPAWLNWLFASFLRVEGSLLKRMNFPVGTSVLLVGRKDQHTKAYPDIA